MLRKSLLIALSCLSLAASAQTAKVQFINNCPDVQHPSLDIYMDGLLVLNDFTFRSATNYLDVSTQMPVTFAFAPQNSNSDADAFYSMTVVVSIQDTIIAVANGMEKPQGYTNFKAFSVDTMHKARVKSWVNGSTQMTVVNGSPDLGTIDIRTGIKILHEDIAYGKFGHYADYNNNADHKLRITNTKGDKSYKTYAFSPITLSWAGLDKSAILLTSGFENPSANSNGPSLELLVIDAAGGNLIPLPVTDAEAISRYQLINNSADAMADTVDVYMNGEKMFDDLAYLHATKVFDVMAKVAINIAIAPQNSLTVADAFYTQTITFDSTRKYTLIADGIASTTGYTPAPPYAIKAYANMKEEAAVDTTTEIIYHHGSTDYPQAIVIRNLATNSIVGNNIIYGAFEPNYFVIGNSSNVVLDIKDNNGNIPPKNRWWALPNSAGAYKGLATTVLTSGFAYKNMNSNGPDFGLYIASPLGGKLELLPVAPVSVASIERNTDINIYPNPAQSNLTLSGDMDLAKANATIYDATGRVVLRVNNTGSQINVSSLTAGTYYIKLQQAAKTGVQQFVKQ